MAELLESKAPVLIRAPPKDGSRKSERVYLNGMSDFEGHAMCLEHQECRLSQDELGDVLVVSMPKILTNTILQASALMIQSMAEEMRPMLRNARKSGWMLTKTNRSVGCPG
jgi:hypothetical protein